MSKTPKADEVRKTITISGKSWHGRIYKYWLNHPASRYWTSHQIGRENLCHLMRVLFIWAPLHFLAYARPKKRLTWLRPWMPLVTILVIISLTLGFVYAPVGTWGILGAIGIYFLGISLIMGTVFLKVDWWDKRSKKIRNGDGFVTVLKETVKAKKAKICPFIERIDMD